MTRHRADDHEDDADAGTVHPYEFELFAELDRMHTMVELLKAVHVIGDYSTCSECAWPWPCSTIRTIHAHTGGH